MSFQRSVFCPRSGCLWEYFDFFAWCLAFYDQAWNLNQPLCLCKSLNDNIVGVGKFSMAPFVKACPKIGVSVLTASLRWSLLSASGVGWPATLPLASIFPNDVVPNPGHDSEVLNQNTQVCPMSPGGKASRKSKHTRPIMSSSGKGATRHVFLGSLFLR